MIKVALADLADEALQARLWFATEGPEFSSFTEAICHLFDDTALGYELDRDRTGLTPEIDDALKQLAQLSLAIDDAHDSPEEAFADSRIHDMRSLARDILFSIVRLELRDAYDAS